jgi:predicted PhzF superfamily epimerase YddE/YHI9
MAEQASPAEVEALAGAPAGDGSFYAWAWLDKAGGTVRSRYFAPAIGIAEDEATGVAAVVLTDRLGRDLEIHQGRGSLLRTRVGPGGTVDLGGTVALVERRPFGA